MPLDPKTLGAALDDCADRLYTLDRVLALDFNGVSLGALRTDLQAHLHDLQELAKRLDGLADTYGTHADARALQDALSAEHDRFTRYLASLSGGPSAAPVR